MHIITNCFIILSRMPFVEIEICFFCPILRRGQVTENSEKNCIEMTSEDWNIFTQNAEKTIPAAAENIFCSTNCDGTFQSGGSNVKTICTCLEFPLYCFR